MSVNSMYEEMKSKLSRVVPDFELRYKAELAEQINQLKKEKNAIILGHNYMEPALFYSIPDFRGDSLDLSRKAAQTDKDIIVELKGDPTGTPFYINLPLNIDGVVLKGRMILSGNTSAAGELAASSTTTKTIGRIRVKRNVADGQGDANVRLVLIR